MVIKQTRFGIKSGKDPDFKNKNKLVTIFLIISFFLFVSSLFQTINKVGKVKREVDEREMQLKKLEEEERKLQEKYDEVTSPEYMEKQLRNQMNFSKENEVILIMPEDEILRMLVPSDETEEKSDITPNWKKWAEVFDLM